MPIINMTLIEGRSDERKRAMYRAVTEAVHETLGAPKESIRIIVNEVPPTDFAIAGEPKSGPSS